MSIQEKIPAKNEDRLTSLVVVTVSKQALHPFRVGR